jgi:hypothetical protein
MTAPNGTLESSKHSDKEYVHFVHASLGFPAPTNFMNAARKGFINGTNQYTRSTSKLVVKHMPNAVTTARGDLEWKPASKKKAKADLAHGLYGKITDYLYVRNPIPSNCVLGSLHQY